MFGRCSYFIMIMRIRHGINLMSILLTSFFSFDAYSVRSMASMESSSSSVGGSIWGMIKASGEGDLEWKWLKEKISELRGNICLADKHNIYVNRPASKPLSLLQIRGLQDTPQYHQPRCTRDVLRICSENFYGLTWSLYAGRMLPRN